MQEELRKQCIAQIEHFSALFSLDGCITDTLARMFLYTTPSMLCKRCTHMRCTALYTCLYGVHEAYRWEGKSIYYCPLGLAFVASSLTDSSGALIGGITLGPFSMGDIQDTLSDLGQPTMAADVSQLPQWEPMKVTHLSAMLCTIASQLCEAPQSQTGWLVFSQDKMLNAVYAARDKIQHDHGAAYPIVYEKQLHAMLVHHDREGAQRLLNELLGHIYFSNALNLLSIKARIVELVVLLSRASIDAGADIGEIFLYNTVYIHKVETFSTIEELSIWLTGVMHRFLQYSFDFANAKHSDVVYRSMEYIRLHYDQKITLEDIARHVYLSRTYLSSLFKEETGQSLFSYLNQVRVEKGKIFLMDKSASLADVAVLCGFEDQSYFTRVFKKCTGLSPKKYRDTQWIQI